MRKMLAGIFTTVVAAVLIFWMTKPFEHLFAEKPTPQYSVGGTWQFTQTSDLDHQAHPGSMTLSMEGQVVSGRMTTWDNTDSAVSGTFVSDGLNLTRETKYRGTGTVQFIEMRKTGPKEFSGTYRNEGTEKDTGRIRMHR
jgi:hypothetical protein